MTKYEIDLHDLSFRLSVALDSKNWEIVEQVNKEIKTTMRDKKYKK